MSIENHFHTILDPNYAKNPICFFKKTCEENNKLWDRREPLDDVDKKIVLSPRPGSTSRSNLKGFENKYKAQFPKKTEKWIKPSNFNNLYCHQKFKRINDESFLLNINKKGDKHKTLNVLDKIIKHPDDTKNNSFAVNYLDSKKAHMNSSYDVKLPFNESTRRSIIGACGNEHGRQWCKFDDDDKTYKQELNYRFKL